MVELEGHRSGPQPATVAPAAVLALYDACQWIADERWPYIWDGGHGQLAGPSHGEDPHGPLGLDCSGAVRWALAKAKWIGPSDRPGNTEEWLTYGKPGWGQFATICIVNSRARKHEFIRFTIPGRPGRFWEAAHEGTIVGFVPYMSTAGYTPRRRP